MAENTIKVRIKFAKYGAIRFIGHLDVMRYFQKAIRRAELDIAYSEGFSPHQIMSFASPLSVGHTSEGEYFDIEMNSFPGEAELKERLQRVMVEGTKILSVKQLPREEKNAMASVAAASYLVAFREEDLLPKDWQEKLTAFYARESIPVLKKTKKGEKELDLKESIYALEIRKIPSDSVMDAPGKWAVFLLLNATSGGNIKPDFVLDTFFKEQELILPEFAFIIHRLETYQDIGTEEERNLVPLIWEK